MMSQTVTCTACGSSQSAGSAYCALCAAPFPRTGQPVPPPAPPRPVPAGPGEVPSIERELGFGVTTEPELLSSTQRAGDLAAPAPGARPGGPLLAAPYAGPGRRFAAYVVDALVGGVLVLAVVLTGLIVTGVDAFSTEVQVISADELAQLLWFQLGAGLVGLGYVVGLCVVEGRTGRTLGNRLLGLQTLDLAEPRPIGFWRAVLRWLLLGVGTVLVALSPAFDAARRQGWHDKAARSVVLDVRTAGPASAAPPAGQAAPLAGAGWAAATAGMAGPPTGAPPAPHPVPTGPPAGAGQPPVPGAGSLAAYAPPGVYPASAAAPPAIPPGPAPATGNGQAVPGAPGAPAADPWAFPQAPVGGAPGQDAGLITGVPGASPSVPAAQQAPAPQSPPAVPQSPVTSSAPPSTPQAAPPPPAVHPGGAPRPAPAPTPVPTPMPVPAPARGTPVPSATTTSAADEEPDWDSTRMSVPGASSSRGETTWLPQAGLVLELESGLRVDVERRALVGRNPQAPAGEPWTVVQVEDPTRSVSKTHAEIGVDASGPWVLDRGSTNGTVLHVPGEAPRRLAAGVRVAVPSGTTVQVGDRRVVVRSQDST